MVMNEGWDAPSFIAAWIEIGYAPMNTEAHDDDDPDIYFPLTIHINDVHILTIF